MLLNWHPREFLIAGIVLSLAYWVVGEGLGGLFQGGATDPNSGPLLVLLACSVYSLLPAERSARTTPALANTPRATPTSIPQPEGSK